MAQETKVEETLCSLQTFERNRYFYGKPMTVSDFEAEQRYLIGKHRYVNRLVHGAGVLCGLQVAPPTTGFSAERPAVEVGEGAALDCCGNLIVVGRSSTVEIKDGFDPEKRNYLFIKYAECSKHPVMLAANGSSCEEVCCYNRIQETFEVVASTTAPGGGGTDPQAAPPPPAKSAKSAANPPDAETVCRTLTNAYYEANLKTCPGCDDPLVFLAAIDPKTGEVDKEETARYRSVVFNNSMLHELLCDHVTDYTNPHRTTAEQVRALQSVNNVGNSPTRSWVKNIDLRSGDKTLVVTPETNNNRIDLALGADAVKILHLNEDVVTNLLQSSKTVSVVPNAATKKIMLHTTAAQSVESVGGVRVVGESGRYAPEDHAHDIAEGVVERKHFGGDVYANLLQAGRHIKVEPDAAAQTIKVSSDLPAGDALDLVSSVTGPKRVGESERYAREDHAHDLYINGHSPNEKGEFRLIPGANVTIEEGSLGNELVISAEGGGQSVVATGTVVFENVRPQEVRTSDAIPHNLETVLVAVVLGEEAESGLQGAAAVGRILLNANAKFGDTTAFFPEAPFLMAEVNYRQKTLRVSLKDRRLNQRATLARAASPADENEFTFTPTDEAAPRTGTDATALRDPSGFVAPTGTPAPSGSGGAVILEPDARTYVVRWWAIPARTDTL